MLTPAQHATLKAYIESDPTLSQLPHSGDGAWTIADALKSPASPEFIVWRTSVSRDEIMQNGFDWVQVDNLTVGICAPNRDRARRPVRRTDRAGYMGLGTC